MSGEFLSPEGLRRKAAMAAELSRTVVHYRRRRIATRWAVAALLLVGLVFAWPRGEEPVPRDDSRDEQIVEGESHAPRFENFSFATVATEPNARTASWIVRDTDVSKFFVDDDSLGHLLRQSGRDTGFMRRGEAVALLVPLDSED